MTTSHTGGCLCGAVRYSIAAPIKELRACHCLDCQRSSGAHGAVVAFVRRENFSITSGAPKRYAKKADSGRTLVRYFCGDCGSPIYATSADASADGSPRRFGLRVGTIRQRRAIRPAKQIWQKSALEWVPPMTHLETFAEEDD